MREEKRNGLDPAEIDRIAELCRLSVPEEKRPALLRDMEALLSFADRISEATDGCSDSAPACAPLSSLREDDPSPSMPRDELLRSAPRAEDGFVIVPSLMEG